MEVVEGGGLECGIAVVTAAAAFVGLVTLTAATGGLATAAAEVGWSLAPTSVALACK